MLHRSVVLGALSICAPLLLLSSTTSRAAVIPQAYYWDDYNHNIIYRATTPGGPAQVIYSGGTGAGSIQPTDLAIDQVNRQLYWTDDSGSNPARILRSNLDGSNVTTILSDPVPNGNGDPSFIDGLRLDTQHNWIYFTEQSGQSVRRVHLDGTGEQKLITATSNGAIDIAFDFAHNRMFWDEIHSTVSVIMSANLDGTASHQVFTDQGFYYGLELDPTGQYLYFTDQDPDFGRVGIRRINVNGTNPIVLIPQPTGSWPQGMDLDPFNNKLYWVVHNTDMPAVYRANLDGSGVELIHNATNVNDPPALWDVAVLYPPGTVPEPTALAGIAMVLLASQTMRRRSRRRRFNENAARASM